MTPTMEEIAGWLREEGRRIFSYWLEAAGDEFATKKSTLWFERAAQVEAMGWRPVKEAKLSVEYRCLLCNGITVIVGYWDGSRWINERSVFRSTYPATHFMPLPAPPVKK